MTAKLSAPNGSEWGLEPAHFIVRIWQGPGGLRIHVHDLTTGEKQTFHTLEQLFEHITAQTERDAS